MVVPYSLITATAALAVVCGIAAYALWRLDEEDSPAFVLAVFASLFSLLLSVGGWAANVS